MMNRKSRKKKTPNQMNGGGTEPDNGPKQPETIGQRKERNEIAKGLAYDWFRGEGSS